MLLAQNIVLLKQSKVNITVCQVLDTVRSVISDWSLMNYRQPSGGTFTPVPM